MFVLSNTSNDKKANTRLILSLDGFFGNKKKRKE